MASIGKIVVAGAGVMGLSCAWRLASAGARVEVLDPRKPGHGATLASLGALWPPSPLARGALQEFDRASLWQFEAFATQLSAEANRPVSYRRLGRMEILNSVKANKRAAQEADVACHEWPAFGDATMRVVDFQQAQQINPGVAPFAHGALHCRATAQVKVADLVAALIEACRGRGVKFHEGSMTALLKAGERVRGVETSLGRIEADAVLVTAGAWTPQVAGELAHCSPIVPAKGQGLALSMPASRPITTILKSGPIYLIPWDDEVLVGSTTEPEAGFDESTTEAAREKLLAGACALVPALKESRLLRHWAGLRPASDDDLPVMGPVPGAPGAFVCAGHYKTGIAMSPLASEWMAKLMVEGITPPEMTAFLPRK